VTALDPAPFADLLAGYCLEVQGGESVLVRSTSLAAPLLLELQRAILEREAWPLLRVELPGQTPSYYAHARDRHLDDYPDLALTEAKRIDALVGIQAPGDVRELAGVDPDRITRYARARRPIREATMKKRCARRCGRPRRSPRRRAWRSRTSRPSCAARCSSTSPTR
jgi:aminopeptidase